MQPNSRKIAIEEYRDDEGDGRWHEEPTCFNAFVRDVESGRYNKPIVTPPAALDEMLS